MLYSAVELSDEIYAKHDGQPAEASTAVQEVNEFNDKLRDASGLPGPVFGAYADAEAKMRALNDLMRSAATLLSRDDTHVGYVNALRAAIETAARLYWVLAPDGGHLDRAGRFLRERLRVIGEVSKFNAESRAAMATLKKGILDGAAKAEIPVPGQPSAVDLIADLVNRPGVLRLGGIDRGEAAAIFYRLPSAPTHAAMHGLALHHANPTTDPSRRRTAPEPWEHTLIVSTGLYAGYHHVQRALLALYGWDTTAWHHHVSSAAAKLTLALEAERVRIAGG